MSYSPSMSSIFPSQDTTRIRVLMSPARTLSSCVPDRVCYDVRAELGFAKGHASCLTFITFHDYVRTWTIPPHSTQPNFTMYVVTLTVSYFSRWMLNVEYILRCYCYCCSAGTNYEYRAVIRGNRGRSPDSEVRTWYSKELRVFEIYSSPLRALGCQITQI